MRRVLSISAVALTAMALSGTPALAAVEGGAQLGLRGHQVNPMAGATSLPTIHAKSWVLADATTGEILAAKNAHLQRPPASTLKQLTALTLMPELNPAQTYVARASDPIAHTAEAGVVPGVTYTVEQLYYGMMLPSGNDAARALGHANGGIGKTVAQMNRVAAQLQAKDTVAKTPNGLDTPGQVSSAYDLALFARAGLQMPAFAQVVSSRSAPFPGKGGALRTIYTNNHLMLANYPGCIGVKTGFTSLGGRVFVAAARRHGITLIVSLMKITDPSKVAAARLLDWGFANHDKVTPVGQLVDPLTPLPKTAIPAPTATTAAGIGVGAAPGTPTQDPTGTAATSALQIPPIQQSGWPPAAWFALAIVVVAILATWWVRRRRRQRPHSLI